MENNIIKSILPLLIVVITLSACSEQCSRITTAVISPTDNKSLTNNVGSMTTTANTKLEREQSIETSTLNSSKNFDEPSLFNERSVSQSLKNDNVNKNEISGEVEKICRPLYDLSSEYSIEVFSLKDDAIILTVSNTDNKSMVSASLIKLFVAGAVYENIDIIKSYEHYAGETDSLISAMISLSDNQSCNTLITRLGMGSPQTGMDAVNRFCYDHNYYDTKINRLMLDFNGQENYTSVNDCTKILKDYYYGNLKGSEDVISYMKNQSIRTKIPAGISDNTLVANKTGELATVENDTAIVYAPSGDYIISVMTDKLSNTELARDVIINISSMIYNYMC